jgi:excisionase family DNA binding protein
METKPDDSAGSEGLLSPQQVAEFLGVSVTTIYQWRYRSEGPAGFKLGGRVRYRRSDLEAWLQRHADDWGR